MKLYKYKGASNISDLERDLDCVINNNIWFSKIESLNDPYEGILMYEKPEDYDYLLPKFQYSTDEFEKLQSLKSEEQKKRIGILSLSKTKNNLVMWSHYADNHKGYVIEYDFDNESFNIELNANKIITNENIKYLKQIKRMPLFNARDYEYLLNKSFGWKYEKEYRFISEIYGLYKYDKNCIKSIIIGANTNVIVEQYLKKIANEKCIKIYKSSIDKKDYKMKFRLIK